MHHRTVTPSTRVTFRTEEPVADRPLPRYGSPVATESVARDFGYDSFTPATPSHGEKTEPAAHVETNPGALLQIDEMHTDAEPKTGCTAQDSESHRDMSCAPEADVPSRDLGHSLVPDPYENAAGDMDMDVSRNSFNLEVDDGDEADANADEQGQEDKGEEDQDQDHGHDCDYTDTDPARDEDDYRGRAVSVYAMSSYPGVQTAFKVEYPFQYGQGRDAGTIDSSRTLYADDVEYVTENGRQYCGDYFMPIDQTEQTRQYVIHQVYLKLFDLELTTVPLEDPKYILDIGTGIGEWAIGMAEKYPDCEVFGTDIAPIQPTQQVPFNIEFHIENAEEEWIRPTATVDLVHLRNMAGAFTDWSFIYEQAFECIRPGGWIEILDFDDMYAYQNFLTFYPEGSAIHLLFRGIYEALEKCGRPRGVQHMSKELLMESGFVDIRESVYDLGIGSRASSSYGKFWLFAIVTGIEPTALRLLTRYLGWDADYAKGLCDEVAKETKKLAEDPVRAESFVMKLRVMSGKKPEVPGQWTAQALNETAEINNLSEDDRDTIGSRSNRTLKLDERL
ncbi:S-adenosyl-L-methionine-dependent methyltransferase [Lasiosphaeria miniovina]|uniref:S-adenosyl-L-methionine-dependent methyltransferase n=1 Tax=Lasiosphaeria miniovina TaxID=1954250 RepID=A0AA40DZH5_9PEZI|nr:S-adenosyl-L-methionine-dependent methyltransferase [Lasiosphaeria miniovina]KAK0722329.1 S-adenosyl-L-methionine-dependent methyltransferase [Lasiosphaeria miniovina]